MSFYIAYGRSVAALSMSIDDLWVIYRRPIVDLSMIYRGPIDDLSVAYR